MPQNVGSCHGNGDDHCCYWNSEPCPYLEENTVPGRRWACGLYRQYGDWDVVHASTEYQQVETLWRGSGELWEWLWQQGIRCGTWGNPDGPMGAQDFKVKGNDPQYAKDFQAGLIANWQVVQQGGSCESLCCFGNASYAQDGG